MTEPHDPHDNTGLSRVTKDLAQTFANLMDPYASNRLVNPPGEPRPITREGAASRDMADGIKTAAFDLDVQGPGPVERLAQQQDQSVHPLPPVGGSQHIPRHEELQQIVDQYPYNSPMSRWARHEQYTDALNRTMHPEGAD